MNDKDVMKMTLDELQAEYNAIADSNDYTREIEICTQIIELDSSSANVKTQAFNDRGTAYANLKKFEKAIQDYNKVIDSKLLDKISLAKVFHKRGITHANLEQFKEAIQDYNKATELAPNNAEDFINRGTAYANLKKFEKAIQDYNEAIELKLNYAEAFYNRGTAYAHLNQFEKAIQDYNKVIELNLDDASNARAFYNLGVTYRILGKEEQAINNLKEAQQSDPSVIAKEQIKALEEEFAEKIKQTQKSNREVQEFQEPLENLEKVYQEEESEWFKWSKKAIVTTLFLIILVLFLVACGILKSSDTYIIYIFSSIVTFTVIRQYTNAKTLRIEASNRLAMAKMFEKVHHEGEEYEKEFLPKLVDAIVYSTRKEQGHSNGMIEKIIDKLNKLKK